MCFLMILRSLIAWAGRFNEFNLELLKCLPQNLTERVENEEVIHLLIVIPKTWEDKT